LGYREENACHVSTNNHGVSYYFFQYSMYSQRFFNDVLLDNISFDSRILHVYLFSLKERRKIFRSILEVVLRTLKDKSLIIVFTCLLIAYAVLYFVVPLYVMGYVNKENREGLQSLVSGIIEDSVNGTERVRKIYEWMTNSTHLTNVYRSCSIDNYIVFIPKPPFICLRLVGEEYPLWFLSSRCGACMEYSLLFREMANAANLTVRSVHNPGEDHNWDEVLINGEWIIVDAGWPILNPSSSFYEVGRGLNVSYVYGMYLTEH